MNHKRVIKWTLQRLKVFVLEGVAQAIVCLPSKHEENGKQSQRGKYLHILDEASTKDFVLRIHKVFLQVNMKTKPQWKKMVKN
jgi:hypothetical protein